MSLFNTLFGKKPNVSAALRQILKAHYMTQNGLYRHKDGSKPTLEEFKQHGFSKEEYFALVYGTGQRELQSKLMQQVNEVRKNKARTIATRLAAMGSAAATYTAINNDWGNNWGFKELAGRSLVLDSLDEVYTTVTGSTFQGYTEDMFQVAPDVTSSLFDH